MNSLPIDKKYKVTIEFDLRLLQIRDYSNINKEDLKAILIKDIESQLLIQEASNHIADEVLGYHEEENSNSYDYIDFNVDNFKLKYIEEE